MTLAERIERRIREIPAVNPGFISFRMNTLASLLDSELIRKIAQEAADEAQRTGEP